MQRPLITVPPALMRGRDFTWDIDWRGQGAGVMTEGTTKTIYAGFPRWVGSPQVTLHGETLLAWRALRARGNGRRGIYRVPMVDPVGFLPADAGATAQTAARGVPWSDDALFSDGVGFLFDPFVLAALDAAAGARTVRVDTSSASDMVPKAGQIMSHDDWPFMVVGVRHITGTVYDLTVEMPLRAAISAGAEIKLRAYGRFEAMEEDMGAPSYGLTRVATPRLTFMEVLAR
jgi:hypothetical protein